MIKIINHIKAGAKIAPALIIILYYLFVTLDIYTTFLVTPDLKYEVNWFIRIFNLNWSKIIICATIVTILLSLLFLITLSITHKYFNFNINKNDHFLLKEIIHKKELSLSFLLFGCFYSHLFGSGFVTINNILNFIYLHRSASPLNSIATGYVKIETFFQSYYYIYTQIIVVITGFAFTFIKVKQIRNKYRSESA
jgi:hypothetical protein